VVYNPSESVEFTSMQVLVNIGGATIFVMDVERFEQI
jgi:uncharacterized protein YaaQ